MSQSNRKKAEYGKIPESNSFSSGPAWQKCVDREVSTMVSSPTEMGGHNLFHDDLQKKIKIKV